MDGTLETEVSRRRRHTLNWPLTSLLIGMAVIIFLVLLGHSRSWFGGPASSTTTTDTNTNTNTNTNTGISSNRAATDSAGSEAAAALKLKGGTQTSEGGGVTVAADWQGAAAGPVFAIVMDTHSVELDGFDLRELAVLRIYQERGDQVREAQPTGWNAPAGGHHRKGVLTFPATAPDGSPLIGPTTTAIELVVRNVAGVPERSLKWTP